MRSTLAAIVTLGCLLAAADPQQEAVKKEFKRLEGTWTVTAAEKDGQALDRIRGGTLTVSGENFVIKTKGGAELKGDLRLNPAKKPKTMDLAHQEGLLRDKTWEGIYELQGDDLKLCYAEADSNKDRPSDFTTAAESGRLLVIMKREQK